MNISLWIERNASFAPTKAALRFEGRAYTYAALAEQVERAARVLKGDLGVGRGNRVAHVGYNSPEFLIVLFACARLGAMLVPLNWRLAAPEHLYILNNASVSALFLERSFAHLIEPVRGALPQCRIVGLDFVPKTGAAAFDDLLASARGESDHPHVSLDCPVLIVYTAGTTGHPKGAVLTQEALQWNAINSAHMHDLTSDDHILTVLPMFHVGGLNIQTTPALHAGATVTLHRRFHADQTLAAITSERPTMTVLVPATMQACLDSRLWPQTDFRHLRIVTTGSTTVPHHLSDAFRARGVCVLEVYGSTETCPIAIYTRPDSDFSKRSTGLPALHCQIRVVDSDGNDLSAGAAGEILVKGSNVMLEYWGNPATTAEALRDGWYHTGDICYRDEDGYFFIVDRKKNVIISGGENIYPAEVERVLLTHPDVREAAVIGVPDARWQEIPVAVVVPANDTRLSEDALRSHLEGQLARYKIPRRFIFTDELPRNAMGKVQHFRVKELFAHR